MAKITIKGNNWMPRKWQDRTRKTKRFIPLLAALLGVLCLTAGIVLASGPITMTELYNSNHGDTRLSDTTVTISSDEELCLFNMFVQTYNDDNNLTMSNVTFRLEADVAVPNNWAMTGMTGTKGAPIVFDGNGHSISGIQYTTSVKGSSDSSPVTAYAGLFRGIAYCTVKDLTLKGGAVTAEGNGAYVQVGGLTGYAGYCTFENCVNYLNVTGIQVCSNARTVAYHSYVGGLVGFADEVNFYSCKNYGEVISACATWSTVIAGDDTTAYVENEDIMAASGGIVGCLCNMNKGDSETHVADCENHGSVYAKRPTVDNEEFYKSVSYVAGGIIGANADLGKWVSGEYVNTVKGDLYVTNCTNDAHVAAWQSPAYAGGIMGLNTMTTDRLIYFTDCENSGYIAAVASGGILGYSYGGSDYGSNTVAKYGGRWNSETEHWADRDGVKTKLTVSRCTNYGLVKHMGGVERVYRVGELNDPEYNVAGGIVGGVNHRMVVSECANYGPIGKDKNSYSLGGIVGHIGRVDSGSSTNYAQYAYGIVSLYSCANYYGTNMIVPAGLVGQNCGRLIIVDCFSDTPTQVDNDSDGKTDGETVEPRLVNYSDGLLILRNTYDRSYHRYNYLNGGYNSDILAYDVKNWPATDADTVLNLQASKNTQVPLSDSIDTNFQGTYFNNLYAKDGVELKNNPLYWGFRYNNKVDNEFKQNEFYGAVLGQKLTLTFPKPLGEDVQMILLKQDGELSYKLPREGDGFVSGGIFAGDYDIFLVHTKDDGTTEEEDIQRTVTVKDNAALTGTMDRYAVTEEVDYAFMVVTFMNGDETFTTRTVLKDTCVEQPEGSPELDINHAFVGWSENGKANNLYDFDKPVTKDLILYAAYEELDRATVTVTVDGADYLVEGAVTLRQENEIRYTMPLSDRGRHCYETRDLEDGTYNVFLDGVDTGRTLTVSDGTGKVTITIFTVSFYTDAGTVYKTDQVFIGGTVKMPAEPTRDGYLFRGWYTDAACETEFDAEQTIQTTTGIYAKWEEITGAVVDLTLDGAPITDAAVALYQSNEWRATLTWDDTGKRYINPAVADGTYDIFINGENAGRSITVTDGNGGATVSYFTVTLDYNDGVTAQTSRRVLSGETFMPDDPTRAEYNFTGWNLKGEGGEADTPYDAEKPITKAITLVAQWEAVTGAVVDVRLDGYALKDAEVALYQNGEKRADLTSNGKDDAEHRYVNTSVPDGVYDIYVDEVNITVGRRNTGRTLTVTNGNGGATVNYFTALVYHNFDFKVRAYWVLSGETFVPETPEREGYRFVGWYTDRNFEDPYDGSLPVLKYFQLFAKWEALTGAAVTVQLDGVPYEAGTVTLRQEGEVRYTMQYNAAADHRCYEIRDGAGNLVIPSDDTYAIYLDGENTGRTVTVSGGEGSASVTAYTVTFLTRDNSGYQTYQQVRVFNGGTLTMPEDPVREGYLFRGWYTDEDCTKEFDAGKTIQATTSVYSKWEKVKGAVVDVILDGDPYAAGVVTLRQQGEILYTLEYQQSGDNAQRFVLNKVADGTYTIYIDGENTGRSITVADGNGGALVTLYTVTFYQEIGTVYKTERVFNGNTPTIPDEPTWEGHLFRGWFYDSIGEEPFDAAVGIEKTTKVYAKWEAVVGAVVDLTLDRTPITDDAYVALYQNNEWRAALTSNGLAGSDHRYINPTVADGTYDIFVNGVNSGRTITIISGNGGATVSYFTVTLDHGYEVGGVRKTEQQLILSGSSFMPDDAERPEFHFAGWYVKGEEGQADTAYDAATPVTETVTLIAHWTAMTGAVVELRLDNSADTEPRQVDLFQNGIWCYTLGSIGNGQYRSYDVADGVYEIYLGGAATGHSLTVKDHDGKAGLDYYTVSFDLKGGTGDDTTRRVLSGDTVTLPVEPYWLHHVFVGWFTDEDCTVSFNAAKPITAKTMLYAKWEAYTGAAIYVTLNGDPYAELTADKLQLRMAPNVYENLTVTDTPGLFKNTKLADGTYAVYLNGKDTGKTVTVTGGMGDAVYLDCYSVTLDYGYDSKVETLPPVLEYTPADIPVPPPRSGYVFRGWYSDQAFDHAYLYGTLVTEKTTIYAKWEKQTGVQVYVTLDGVKYSEFLTGSDKDAQKHTLSLFDATGKEFPMEQVAGTAGLYTVKDAEDGYYTIYVDGAYSGKGLTLTDNISTPVTLVYYTVTLHYWDGEEAKQIVAENGTATVPETKNRIGYVFRGWYTNASYENAYVAATPITKTTTIYAKWEEETGVQVYVTLDGVKYSEFLTGSDQDAQKHTLSLFDATGKEFPMEQVAGTAGLYTVKDAEDGYYTIYVDGAYSGKGLTLTDNISTPVTLVYYTVTLHYWDGKDTTQIVAENGVATVPETASRSGYVFRGWYTNASYENAYVAGTPITKTTTIYAQWASRDGVKVYATLDGDAYDNLADTDLTLRMAPNVKEYLTGQGSGFYANGLLEDGTYSLYYKEEDTGLTTTVTDGTGQSLELKFYTATLHYGYETGGSEKTAAQILLEGRSPKLPKNPIRSGYVFMGWYADEALETAYGEAEVVTTATHIYAKWLEITGVQVRVTLDGKARTDVRVTLRQENEVVYTLVSGTDGYGLEQGVEAADGTYEIFINGVNTSRTVEVLYHSGSTTVSYATVTFYDAEGKVMEAKEVLVGNPVTAPFTTPEKVGNSFEYWRDSAGNAYDFSAPVEAALSLYPNWVELTYTVTAQIEHVIYTGDAKATYAAAVSGKIEPEEGYLMPKSIAATMGGDAFTAFQFDSVTGSITIARNTITGDIVFTGSGVEIQSYAVTSEIRNGVLYGMTADTKDGYTGTLKASAGFTLPSTLTATMDGEIFTAFQYNPQTGKITVAADKLKGALCFSGECGASLQTVSYKLRSAVGNGKLDTSTGNVAEALQIHIVPNSGHTYPKALVLVMNGRRFVGFTYDSTTGMLRIPSGQANGTLMVLGTCPKSGDGTKTLTEQPVVTKKLHE